MPRCRTFPTLGGHALGRRLRGGARIALAVALVAFAGCQRQCDTTPRETLRLLVETGGETDPAAVEGALEDHFDRPEHVEALFEGVDPNDDPELLSQMFLAVVAEGRAEGENAWDLAYGAEEATGYRKVEPDRDRTLGPATEAAVAEAALCFVEDSVEAPADRAWSLENMRVPAAWDLEPAPGGRAKGEGIRVCHPDTGWSEHLDLDPDRLDLANAKNLLRGGTPDARDPLDYSGLLLQPGHGTATGSVIVSGLAAGEVSGVAPAARIVPIRTAKSVVQVFDSDLARAVRHAVVADCDVISMSLGGRAYFGLGAAIRNARRKGLIVLAAAGNCVKFVVAPAAYDHCIAVAGTNVDDRPWIGSSRGRKVAISAPGQHVWVAHRKAAADPTDGVKPGEGTSYSVAGAAGVAALWLAHHDLDRDAEPFLLHDLFVELLRETARRPPGWESLAPRYGAGIVDAEALLQRPLPDLEAEAAAERAPMQAMENLELLSNITGRPESAVALSGSGSPTSAPSTGVTAMA